jgi:hypothetical protein
MTKFAFAMLATIVLVSPALASESYYQELATKQEASVQRAQDKLARLKGCVANPEPCFKEDSAKAQKSADRAAKKLERLQEAAKAAE